MRAALASYDTLQYRHPSAIRRMWHSAIGLHFVDAPLDASYLVCESRSLTTPSIHSRTTSFLCRFRQIQARDSTLFSMQVDGSPLGDGNESSQIRLSSEEINILIYLVSWVSASLC